MRVKKTVVIALLVLAVALFFGLGLQKYLTFEYLKASKDHFSELYARHPLAVLGAYFGIYVLVTAASLPGAAILTLAGGGLFGFWTGLAVVSFASTMGAALACLMARYVLRDWVRERFGSKLARVDQGVAAEGAYYLFTMRLIPVFPFFLVNLLMGLTAMKVRTFYWVSQLGMLPGTAVYVNAGNQLSRIESPAQVLTPEILLSFALLGLFPLAAKKAVALVKARRHANPK